MKKENEELQDFQNEPLVYEVAFHIIPTIAEENIAAEVSKIRDVLDAVGARVLSEEYPKEMKLGYPISKKIANKKFIADSSYFGWIKFEAFPENIETIKGKIENIAEILRFLIVKTVREDTMFIKKPFISSKKQADSSEGGQKKDAEEIALSEEELDKTIEDLVIS